MMVNGAPIAGLDLDGMPTGAAIRVLHSQVTTQHAHIEAMHGDLAEIKTTLKSFALTAKILVASVPVVAAIASGIIWAALHLSVKP